MAEPWRLVQFEDLLMISRSGYWGDEVASEARPNPVRVIRNADVTRDGRLSGWAERFFSDKELSRASLQLGDTVLCTSGEVGKALLVTREGFAATNFTRILRPDASVVDSRYLRILLDGPALKRQMAQHTGATTLANLRTSFYSAASIDLPSLGEQRRIVDLIESVDTYIDALRAQADAARTARTSLLHELLIDTSGDWTETTLDAVGTWRSGGTPKAGDPRFYGGDIPFVAIGDLTGGVIRTTEKTLTPVGLAEIGHLAPEGSIFVSMYGSIGKTGVAGANMATNQAIAWLEPDLTVIDPAFMASWLTNHAAVFDSQGRGATQRNINRKMIRETPIVLPPLRVQNEIAHTAASINNLIGRIEETLSRAATVRQGILAELLSGNHEIPESYDALLEAS